MPAESTGVTAGKGTDAQAFDRHIAFLRLRDMYAEIGAELSEAAARALASGWYILGPEVEAFEREFARFTGSAHAVGVANGLDALTLVLRAWDVGPGDEVIVPSNTYVATWLAVTAVGATIVPVEPDGRTYVIEADAVRAAITPLTRVVLPVHLYGLCADLEPVRAECRAAGIRILEDAAQAHGAHVRGVHAGALGDAAAWSFYPTKNLGALGDAGAVTTNDAALVDRLRVLRNYGSRQRYVNEEIGVNSRLDELQAALLRAKLAHLPEWNARRERIAALYLEQMAGLPLQLPVCPEGRGHVWHVFPVRVESRDEFREALLRRGVETIVHYPIPPHLQHAYAPLGFLRGAFPVAEAIHEQVVSLPIGAHMSLDDAAYVARAVRAACAELGLDRVAAGDA